MIILILVFAAFISAPLVGLLGKRSSPMVALAPALLFLSFAFLAKETATGKLLLESYQWIPTLGIGASFRLDGLSIIFALLITGIGCAVFLYASAYLKGEPRLMRFYVVLTLFMASMLGAVLSDDLLLLIVFWELTSITSFLLIGYSPESAQSRRSAQQGLLITVAGGLSMLAGIILLGSAAGTYSISEILVNGSPLTEHASTPAIIILIAVGAFSKSAQVPLHSWLANAMVAPTPVSAYLHSATMVKLGVYLLARLDAVFSDNILWMSLLCGFGAATMLTGSFLAMRETDLKRILAYSTIVSLGTLIMLVGVPGHLASIAVVTFLIAHALYKACLFMVAGIVDHETGSRDATALHGLRHLMPITALIAVFGGLSMAGLPPFLGFLAKELIYEAGLSAAGAWGLIAIAVIANATMAFIAAIMTLRCFFGPLPRRFRTAHDPSLAMLSAPAILALLGGILGVVPWFTGPVLISPGASAVAEIQVNFELSLWHGFTPMLALSVFTLIVGSLIYSRWNAIRIRLAGLSFVDDWGPDKLYDRLISGLQFTSRWVTDKIQPGSLRGYVARTLIVISFATLATLVARNAFELPSFANIISADVGFAILLIAAAITVGRARDFVSGIIAAGLLGFTVALLFLFQGAPDLAFTQFSVEALAVIIMLAIVGRMPFRDKDTRQKRDRWRDLIVAGITGLSVTAVMLSVLAQPFNERLSDFFRSASVPDANGRNLVNVILVDFRALDTLGEITVLGLAAVAAAAVLAGIRRATAEKNK